MRLGKSDDEKAAKQAAAEAQLAAKQAAAEAQHAANQAFQAERESYSGDRWDYHVEVMKHGLGFRGEKLSVTDLEKRLDELGRQGFELATVHWDADLAGQRDGHLMIFKRRIKISG